MGTDRMTQPAAEFVDYDAARKIAKPNNNSLSRTGNADRII
jgi:hypothetical protein